MNTFSTKTYSLLSGQDSKLYKRVTARSYDLNRLDGTMTDLQNATLRPVYILSSCRLTSMYLLKVLTV